MKRKRGEKRDSTFFVFGRRTLVELYRHRPNDILRLLIARGVKPRREILEVLEGLRFGGVAVEEVEKSDIDELAEGVVHQGVCAEVRPKEFANAKELIERAASASGSALLLLIEHVSDPQNLGALLRAAEAAGVSGVLITKDKTASLSAAARKASAGASEVLDLAYVGNVQQLLAWAKAKGFWVVGSSLASDSVDLYAARLPEKCILAVGSEGEGLRRLTLESCDICVKIPMLGSLASLNVSQAASVMLFEFVRRGIS